MACIERRPNCGSPLPNADLEPLEDIAAVAAVIVSVVTAVVAVISAIGSITVEGDVITIEIGDFVLTQFGSVAGASVAFITAAIIVGTIILYKVERCNGNTGTRECIAGVVNEVVPDFADTVQTMFPFTAMHNRADMVIKSKFWDAAESGDAYVYCTDVEPPERSIIMRCYFYSSQVCSAMDGAIAGGIIGGLVGTAGGYGLMTAIACAGFFLCLLVLLLVVAVAAIFTLAGAAAGGNIAMASSGNSPAVVDDLPVSVGDYLTVRGHMEQKGYDNGANVIWWVDVGSSSLSGQASSDVPSNPYSYCDLDEDFEEDACNYKQ